MGINFETQYVGTRRPHTGSSETACEATAQGELAAHLGQTFEHMMKL